MGRSAGLFVMWLAACAPGPGLSDPEDNPADPASTATDDSATPAPATEPATQPPADADADGSAADADCDDADATRHPNAAETCGDAQDQDCDPSTECPMRCVDTHFFAGSCAGRSYGGPAPVSWWGFEAGRLEDGVGGPTPVVAVGTPAVVPGVVGDALGLDGSTRLAAKFVPGAAWTVAWWQRLDALPTDAALDIALDVGNGPEPFTGFALGVWVSGASGGYLEFGGSSGETFVYDDTPICTVGWVHRAAAYDGRTFRSWVDGVPDQILQFDRTIPWGSNPLSVGGSANREDRSIRGAVDEIVWFDGLLSDDAVAGLFRDGLCGIASFEP